MGVHVHFHVKQWWSNGAMDFESIHNGEWVNSLAPNWENLPGMNDQDLEFGLAAAALDDWTCLPIVLRCCLTWRHQILKSSRCGLQLENRIIYHFSHDRPIQWLVQLKLRILVRTSHEIPIFCSLNPVKFIEIPYQSPFHFIIGSDTWVYLKRVIHSP